MLSWGLKHKTFINQHKSSRWLKIYVQIENNSLSVACVQYFFTTILLFLDDGQYLTVDLVVNPVQWQNRLPGSLWVLASHLFMGLIAYSSSSSLGDEMFELLGQSTDVVLASLVHLEKGRRKEQ